MMCVNIQAGKSHGFCLDILYGCSNTLYGHSDRIKFNFSMFSHLYPESYTPYSSTYFPDQMRPEYPL